MNVKARLPAWAKGKSVILDMTKTHIKLALKEEEATPIIEVQRRSVCMTAVIGFIQYLVHEWLSFTCRLSIQLVFES